jgi:tRNA dimethylallyltransferase
MTENQQTKRLIVVAGPTAVGKTSFAIKLAKYFDTEILSCDSRQLFKEMKIGVARPTREELAEVKHHFIASHSIHSPYDAGMYAQEVDALLAKLFVRQNTVIMTGGTGLYIKAATEGLDALPQQNKQLREQLSFILKAEGIDAIQDIATGAKISKETVDYSNPQRLMRAIEIAQSDSPDNPQKEKKAEYNTQYYYMDRDRDALYDRINTRVDIMIKDGLEDEAKDLYEYKELNALHTVGYTEFFKNFSGEWTKEHAVEKIKQHTRNYAKRQLTWFRNQGNYQKISTDFDAFIQLINE